MPEAITNAETAIMAATSKSNEVELMEEAVKSENKNVKETIDMQQLVLDDALRKKEKIKEQQ